MATVRMKIQLSSRRFYHGLITKHRRSLSQKSNNSNDSDSNTRDQLDQHFKNLLSEDNKSLVQHRLQHVKPARTEKHVPLKPNHGVAAVLVPLCTVNQEPSIMLTLRSRKLAKYRGQVCFPGGNVDLTDPDVVSTALRETQEELGIDPSAFTVWGHMASLPASQDGKLVHPVLASIGEIDVSKLNISQDEVEEVFTVSIRQLCDLNHIGCTRFRSKHSYTLPVYTGGLHRIWGFTAIVTHMLLCILAPDLYKYELKHKHSKK